MTYCSNCGKELPVDSKFCPSCGTTIPTLVNTNDDNIRREPIRTEPIRTEPVRTEPIRTEPVITQPVRSERVVTSSSDINRDHIKRTTVNEFYKDAGFWGSLLVLAGFFLPFFSMDGKSLFDTVQDKAATESTVLIWLAFPAAALVVLLHSLIGGWPGIITTLFILLALVAAGMLVYVLVNDPVKYFGSADMSIILKTAGLGLWLTLLGTLLMVFHSKKKKVEVHRTKVIDRTL